MVMDTQRTHAAPVISSAAKRSREICRAKGFPMVMTRSGASFRQETIREGFPMVVTGFGPTPDRKLYENKNPLLHGEDF